MLLRLYGKRLSQVIADSQYYSAEVFKTIRGYGAEPVIPHPTNVKQPLINLYVAKHFKIKGEERLVELYKDRMLKEPSRLQRTSY
jgi:hypothetical protein